jgi:hypothetical protein
MVRKAASGVLVARPLRRTHVYASVVALPAALLDSLFDHPAARREGSYIAI